MKQAKEKVKELLEQDKRCRDNDNLLQVLIWESECEGSEKNTTLHFLASYSKGKFTSAESIRRCRQKLQEENPELRGELYNVRHKVLEPEVRKQIKQLNNNVEIE